MARKNFRATGGINIDTTAIPVSVIQETITSNSATTVDTIALNSFIASEYTVTLTQGSKVRTSKVIVQTDGTSVDMTEFAITETGGTMSGVVVSATTASTNAVLQITVTDAASTLVRYKLIRNLTSIIGYAPDAPTIGTVTGGEQQASVAFTAPVDNGGSSIISYTATSNPGLISASNSSSPVVVTGLTGGTEYTFTVTATNSEGTSLPSSASNAVTPTSPPLVVGGTLSSDSTYYYRTFTSSGSLAINTPTSLAVEALVVAGGGGSNALQGGGGAGGVLAGALTLSPATYTITVGSGGANSTNGNNSSIGSTLVSIGGGGSTSSVGQAGGSGAGGSNGSWDAGGAGGEFGAGTANQGFRGGTGLVLGNGSAARYQGGGGGAGGVGYTGRGTTNESAGDWGSNPNFGDGGIGATHNTLIGGTAGPYAFINEMGAATSTGQLSSTNYYYAGGGSGYSNSFNSNTSNPGGLGGGGAGGNISTGGNGSTNTGGGAGSGSSSGGTGGSGIVIVRYLKSAVD